MSTNPRFLGIDNKLWLILIGVISATLIFGGKSDIIINWIVGVESRIDKEYWKGWMFFIGLTISGLILPIRYYLLEIKFERINKLDEILKEYKRLFSKSLGKELNKHSLELNARFFIERNSLKDRFNDVKYFISKPNPSLTNEGTEGSLEFEVSPVQRGIVGLAYIERKVIIDDDLKNNPNKYNLTDYHKNTSSISNADFVIAKPVINSNNKVESILTFDTEQNIKKPNNPQELQKLTEFISTNTDLMVKILKILK